MGTAGITVEKLVTWRDAQENDGRARIGLKAGAGRAHDVSSMLLQAANGDEATGATEARAAAPDFAAVYDRWFDDVTRWIRTLGGPEAELDDWAQEVFLVVRRRLGDFDGRNLPGWLYRITANVVSDQRRRAWFRKLFRRPRDIPLDEVRDASPDPAEAMERGEQARMLRELLAEISEKRRTAFLLFEVEGYSGEEIAALLEIPVATVWTRVHHARKELKALIEARQRREVR